MRDRPEGLDERELRVSLREWGVGGGSLTYAPVGFGDYHWIAAEEDGRRWFVTAADLGRKAPSDEGIAREAADADQQGVGGALRALGRAMDTAAELRRRGLGFVVAPLVSDGGETVRLIGGRHAVSVFPYAEGEARDFGDVLTREDRGLLVETLAELHRTPPPPEIPVSPLHIPTRERLEQAIAESGQVWRGGPYAERARALVAGEAASLRRRLEEFDLRVAKLDGVELVVTHGEPHPGNLLMAGEDVRLMLVDWDTVGLAPPERDLWLVGAEPDELAKYADITGRRPEPGAMETFRLRWALEDVALYVDDFRSPHADGEDAEQGWEALSDTVRQLADDT
jgi:spectinomycin phosphotransferase